MRIENKDEARFYIEKALSCAEKHDTISYGVLSQSMLCGCKKYDYGVTQSGELAHPYGKLKEITITSLKSKPIFNEFTSAIES